MSVNMCLINWCLSSASAVMNTFVVYLQTTKAHNNSVFKELTLLFLLQKYHLLNSLPPMPSDFQSWIPSIPSEFQFKEPPPSPLEILKAVHDIGMGIFQNCPICTKNKALILELILFHKPALTRFMLCMYAIETRRKHWDGIFELFFFSSSDS